MSLIYQWQIYRRCSWLVSTTPGVPLSMTPVVHLDLCISPWIFEKIWIDPKVILRGLGGDDSGKNLKQKFCYTVPLSFKKNLPEIALLDHAEPIASESKQLLLTSLSLLVKRGRGRFRPANRMGRNCSTWNACGRQTSHTRHQISAW
jgi:hypothetical protein